MSEQKYDKKTIVNKKSFQVPVNDKERHRFVVGQLVLERSSCIKQKNPERAPMGHNHNSNTAVQYGFHRLSSLREKYSCLLVHTGCSHVAMEEATPPPPLTHTHTHTPPNVSFRSPHSKFSAQGPEFQVMALKNTQAHQSRKGLIKTLHKTQCLENLKTYFLH